MRKSLEVRQKLGELVTRQREILDLPPEKRTADHAAEIERLDKEMDGLEPEIARLEKQEERERRAGAKLNDPLRPAVRTDGDPSDGVVSLEARQARVADYEKRFGRSGRLLAERMYDEGGVLLPIATAEYRAAFAKQITGRRLNADEERAISVGIAAEGGYTVPAEEFLPRLIKFADDNAPMRQLANVLPPVTQAISLGIPTLAADPADADWTTELATGNEDATMAFGKRELKPNPMAKRIKVSAKWLRATPVGGEGLILERLGYKFGITGEKAFQTGTGVNQPLGIFTQSADGLPNGTIAAGTGRDVEIGDGAAAVDPDKLIDARYALKEAYWPRARWLLHRNWLAKLRKLKSALAQGGNYLWQPGLTAGSPNLFLDFPYTMSEYAPSVTTHGAGVYAAVLGDFMAGYWIVDALTTTIQRLNELYAETNQVGYIGRAEFDGQPVLPEAFVRCLAAT